MRIKRLSSVARKVSPTASTTEREPRAAHGRPAGSVRRIVIALSAMLLLALLLPAAAYAAADDYLTLPLVDNSSGPLLSGDRIVWCTSVDYANQVFTWSPSDGTRQLTSATYYYQASSPAVSGDRVVWVDPLGSPDGEICTWTPAGGMVQITSDDVGEGNPAVSGDRIAWLRDGGSDGGTDSEVFTWTPAGGVVQVSSNSYGDEPPVVSGDRIVWRANYEIYSWTPSGGTVQIPGNSYGEPLPQVSGDRIVWMGVQDSGPGYLVYTWTPTTGTVVISGSDQDVRRPQVSGDRVVWSAYNTTGAAQEIYTWTPSGGMVQLSSGSYGNDYAAIDGDTVAWLGYGGIPTNGYYEAQMFVWTPSGGLVGPRSYTWCGVPRISGGRLVWGGYERIWTTSAAAQIAGTVEGNNGATVFLAGARVTVSLSPSDPNYDSANAANNLVGAAIVAPSGAYFIDVSKFRASGLPLGSIIEVTASMTGYRDVRQTGVYGRTQLVCSFQAFDSLLGSSYEDRRLPVDGGQGALSFAELLPDHAGPAPAIASLSPNTGPTGGGTTVVITGSRFEGVFGANGVTFDGVDAASYTVDSPTQITAVSPPHLNGKFLLQVNANGGAALCSAAQSYSFVAPKITGINPVNGPLAGGNTVVITGTNFAGLSGPGAVTFGGVDATSYHLDSSTQITAVAPPHASGSVEVRVSDGGDQATYGGYTYLAVPTITSVSPSSGPATGGTSVIITGTGFTGVTGADAVTFGGVNASYSVSSSTRISVRAPAHSVGAVHVKVKGVSGTSAETSASQYTYTQPAPTITSLSPSCGPLSGGTTVVITGNYFVGLSGSAAVKFGVDNAASYTVDSATQITAISPAHGLGTVRVSVTTTAGENADTTADDFVYLPNAGTTGQFVPERITNNSYEDGDVQLSGDRVVWVGASDPTDYENKNVYTWTPSEGAMLLSTTSHENQRPRVYGDRVVWYGYGGSDGGTDGEIFTWTPTTGLAQITKNTGDDQTPEVYGDRIVWAGHDSSSIYQIYTWTPSGGTKKVSSETSNPAYPVVSGDRISWCGDGTRVVKTWTAATGIVNVTMLEDAGYKYSLQASGDRLAWNSEGGLYTWTPADSEPVLATSSGDFSLSGGRLAWSTWVVSTSQVFTWTPSGGVLQLSGGSEGGVVPRVSGDFVVWVAYPASGAVIRGWTPAGGIIELATSQCVPAVSGTRVAWSAGDQADSDIYSAIVSSISGTDVSGNSPSSGPTIGGNTVVITGSGFSALSGASALSGPSAAPGALAVSQASAVSFGDAAALSYTVDSDRQITAVAPPHAAGKVDVFVKADDGVSALAGSGNDYVYVPASLTRIENTDSRIRYAGTWALTTTPAGVFSNGSCAYSQSTAASVTVSFTGTSLDWIATRDAVGRSATVSVDGGTPMTVSLYASETQYQTKVWGTGCLPNGTHVVTITRVTGALNVDAFDTNGTLVSFGRVEQTDGRILKSGSWTDYGATGASGATYGRSSTAGASATVWFTGTKIAWVGMTGGTPGIVDVYLDDVKNATLDLYSSPAKYQVTHWTSDTLPDGIHHMDLVRNKDSLAAEYLVLDAVDIWGSIAPPPPTITSLSPSSGSILGGTSVTINGTGFTGLSGSSAVTFDGVDATVYTVNSSTKITAVAPAHAAAAVSVQVTAPSGTASSVFTYAVASPTTRVDLAAITAAGITTSGTWAPYTSASAYAGSYLRSSTASASVVIAFKGTQLDWVSMKGTTGAIADIYVDGAPLKAATVNLYTSPAVYQQKLFSTGTLPDGYHTVKIVRSTSSVSGRFITLDAVEIAGTLVAPVRAEETDSHFTFSPVLASWKLGTTTSASGGTYRYINTAGAYATFTFSGVGFKLIAKTAPSYGNLTVTIDGVSQTVSLYSSATTYKKVVLTAFTTPGTHTVKIARAGTKSSSSSGYTIDLDAIDLIGELR